MKKIIKRLQKAFAIHNVSNSTCDEIFEKSAKIDVDNDIDYGQYPL